MRKSEVMIAFRHKHAIIPHIPKARMLTFLKIRNLALVDQLLWEPQQGFICITGETGAGKSVIIGAIRLALGERADKSLIRSGESQCSVDAVFTLPTNSPIHGMLAEYGISPCEDHTLTVRRILSATANRQFINDCPCTLNLLRDMGTLLVDMHGANDHRSLLSAERQLSLLDAFADNAPLLQNYTATWNAWQQAQSEYTKLTQAEAVSDIEIELLQHRIDEISEAAFTQEEVNALEERWQRARNSARIQETATRMSALMETNGHEQGSSSLSSQLHELIKATGELQRLDPTVESWASNLMTIEIEMQEWKASLDDYLAQLSCDPNEQQHLETRINTLESLKRKYGPQFEDITEHYQEAVARLDQMEHRTERIDELATHLVTLREQVESVGKQLSASRQHAAPLLAQEIITHSHDLGFHQAIFDIVLSRQPENAPPTAHGLEDIDFLFGPNPGEQIRELRLIASSGELARIMLAIKSALAHKDDTPLLVFDEIDSNVGGEIACAVGKKMQTLGRQHQVVSITHFPQVAALAEHHYLVEKNVIDHRTLSRLREISGEERTDELVRMLGGGGQVTKAHAQALLAQDTSH
ncbi:MAG: DNA repair protein RecN [Akkermansia sp.]